MHVGTLRKKDVAGRAEQLAELARIGITVVENDADRRFSRKFRMGYDGVIFCPFTLRNAGRFAPICRPRALVGLAVFSTSLQPFRSRRKLSCGYSNDYLIREQETTG